MKTIHTLLSEPIQVATLLHQADFYLAHLPPAGQAGKKETLAEHMDLVMEYASRLCAANGLSPVTERLIADACSPFRFIHQEKCEEFVRQLFVNALVFHDFGKVNPFFQRDKMQQQSEPLFQGKFSPIFSPESGHSELGAFLFICQHWEEINALPIPDDDEEDKNKLTALTLAFADTILLHHSSVFKRPQERIKTCIFLKKYTELTHFSAHFEGFTPLSEAVSGHLDHIEDLYDCLDEHGSFALYALLKLNFSLLTAADYMATQEYMSGGRAISQMGVFEDREKLLKRIAKLHQLSYNQPVMAAVAQGNFVPKCPQEKSKDNLNQLRMEMAIEVVQHARTHAQQRLFYLEAPTGGGKTNLSMLALAELMQADPALNKVYYVFPFTTLITQTFAALRDNMGFTEDELAEIHSKAVLGSSKSAQTDDAESREDGKYGDKQIDYLHRLFGLFPVSVLSHVRFFDILKTSRKEANYPMHRLANSVVIVDELQAYNPELWDKMLFLIQQYAEAFNMRFILMSATLPRIDKLDIALANQPEFVDLLPDARERYLLNPNFGQRVRFNAELMERGDIDLTELATEVIDRSQAYAEVHGRVHTIVEFIFKKSATVFANEIEKQTAFFDHIFVLSGTILEPRRREIIAFLKNPENKETNILLVTTQVVEAGVDIDMDLGFKNASLLDSDEQLAGRVNRNASKPTAEVFLFQKDKPGVLYGSDLRFKESKPFSPEERAQILAEKQFARVYEAVMLKKDKQNAKAQMQNFDSEFRDPVHQLDYETVDRNFKIIDADNVSVFVPVCLPVMVSGSPDPVFSPTELHFLAELDAYIPGDEVVDGQRVWEAYEALVLRKRTKGFDLNRTIDFKQMGTVMSRFVFSLVGNSKAVEDIKSHCKEADEKYGYYLLTNEKVYSLEKGLDMDALTNTESCFL